MKGKLFGVFLVDALIGIFILSFISLVNVPMAEAARDHLVVQTWGGKLAEAQE